MDKCHIYDVYMRETTQMTRKEKTMSKEKESKYNISSTGRTYGYDKKGGWDIDTSDRTQRTSDSGHIPGRYQWEETVDVSAEDEEDGK